MRVPRSDEALKIKVDGRQLKEIDQFQYFLIVLTREIKLRIFIAKKAFERKI